ncbi:MAG: PD-(D/E)XK nuclease family protein [Halanaerobiaceae bacterium]
MENNLPDDFYFSQHALKLFEQCPLKFRYRYVDGLYRFRELEQSVEQKKLLERGKKFHLLARRYYERGYVQKEGLGDHRLKKWFKRLRRFLPYQEGKLFFPEHELRINLPRVRLLAKYDLVYWGPDSDKLVLYDWKTNKKPLDRNKLRDDLQTVVYLLVMARAVNEYFNLDRKFLPEDIKLIYWNPRFAQDSVSLNYSKERFAKDKKRIFTLVERIKGLSYEDFARYAKKENCRFCQFVFLCQDS